MFIIIRLVTRRCSKLTETLSRYFDGDGDAGERRKTTFAIKISFHSMRIWMEWKTTWRASIAGRRSPTPPIEHGAALFAVNLVSSFHQMALSHVFGECFPQCIRTVIQSRLSITPSHMTWIVNRSVVMKHLPRFRFGSFIERMDLCDSIARRNGTNFKL